ncbi:MAG TPA: hypothetical protein PK264_01695 [Hyphomicrobiaceae bacterium]|nr:hypothetical protein [Hyphomicrobiaceae bacterium]
MKFAFSKFAIAAVLVGITIAQSEAKPISDLIKGGYKCEKVTLEFSICEKDGEKWYCDSTGNCERVKRVPSRPGQVAPGPRPIFAPLKPRPPTWKPANPGRPAKPPIETRSLDR